MPKKKAQISVRGLWPKAAKPTVPATIIVMIPNTRWWTWRPLSLSMFPGHQLTSARIIRVLMRMKAKEPTNPTRTRKTPCRSWSTSWWFQKSLKMSAAGRTVLISSRLRGGDRPGSLLQSRCVAVMVADQVEGEQDDRHRDARRGDDVAHRLADPGREQAVSEQVVGGA